MVLAEKVSKQVVMMTTPKTIVEAREQVVTMTAPETIVVSRTGSDDDGPRRRL
jgi:hypothetical protein